MNNIQTSAQKVKSEILCTTHNNIKLISDKLLFYELTLRKKEQECEILPNFAKFRTEKILEVIDIVEFSKKCPTCIICHIIQWDTLHLGHIHVGIDTEYQQGEKENKVLSYQLWIHELNIGYIFLTEGERIGFKHILKFIWDVLRIRFYKITFCSHFSRAEIQHMVDRDEILKELGTKNIRKTFIIKNTEYTFYDKNKHKQEIELSLYDTFLLSNTSLKNLGGKIDIGENIKNMEKLLKEDKEKYVEYSITDAKISVEWYVELREKIRKLFDLTEQDIDKIFTASSIGEKAFLRFLEKKGIDKNKFLGKKKVIETKFSYKKNKLVKYSKVVTLQEVKNFKIAYHGGRNECYYHGIYKGDVYDYDIKNAYPSAMLTIQDIDWTDYEQVNDVNTIQFNDVGYCRLYFRFKKSVKYPNFAVKTDYGLVFVRTGETTVTLQDLYTALKNNWLEEYKIKLCVRFRKQNSLTIAEYTSKLIKERAKYKKGTVENMLFKLVANSVYGKYTQGIRKKTSINVRKSEKGNIVRDTIKESSIFNAGIASYITSTVRNIVAEYMNYLDKLGVKIFSVTTDGFMTNQKLSDKMLRAEYEKYLPFSSQIAKYREFWLGDRQLLELKHKSGKNTTNFILKTRMYWMYDLQEKDVIIARGGIQAKGERKEVLDMLTNLYLEAYSDLKVKQERLSNILEYFEDDLKDLVKIEREVNANFDFDLKRKVNVKSIKEVEVEYNNKKAKKVVFDTEPYYSVNEFLLYKKAYDNYVRYTQNVNKIQTKERLLNFLKYTILYKYSDTMTKVNKQHDIILNKIIWLLGKKGYNHVEISKMIGVNFRIVRKRMQSKAYKMYIQGDLEMKKINKDDFELYFEYDFRKYTKKLDIDLVSELMNEIIEQSTNDEREKTYSELLLDRLMNNKTKNKIVVEGHNKQNKALFNTS